MEAQKLITMSINKIAGSRRQRGGINLRKNLLVASVLHSARVHYYEEMCNRMPGHIALEQSKPESPVDEDCTESPDWEDEEENTDLETNYDEESDEEDNATAGNLACDVQNSRVVVEQIAVVDKENIAPSGHCQYEKSENMKLENGVHQVSDCDRVAFGNVSQNSTPEACTTTTCLTVPSVKRKRSDAEEPCDSAATTIKRVKVDSQCQTVASPDCGAQSSISSLVDIFKAGFHGLAGEPGNKLSSYVEDQEPSSNNTPSYTTLSTHARPFETLQAAAVIAAC
ncbi:immediate early response gene 5-like protein [Lytechinus pictus]|uniref:immediate early response gene 5-like protein n=1 Tax=Lytechinus pictus TaxID=7653 RepID=UPI0030B9CFE5